MRDISARFERDKFQVNQRRLSLKKKYYVYDEHSEALFYVERPHRFFGGRRNITIFADDTMKVPLLSITQDNYWELWHRNYTVINTDGQIIARLSRNNLRSLFRRGWAIMGPTGDTTAKAREDYAVLAAVRRVLQLIPYVALLGLLIKTDFHFLSIDDAGNEQKIGTFNRRFSLFDKYVLDLSDDPARTLNRKVALAVGILLDTGEKR